MSDVLAEVAKATPPVAVGLLAMAGVYLPVVIMVLTLVYTLLQMYFLIRDKWWRDRKAKNESKE